MRPLPSGITSSPRLAQVALPLFLVLQPYRHAFTELAHSFGKLPASVSSFRAGPMNGRALYRMCRRRRRFVARRRRPR